MITNNRKPYICYSKYIKQYKCLSSANDLVTYLLEIKDDFISKPVVISCADFVTAELDSHKSILDDYFYLPVGNGNIVQVMNKVTMSKIANDCGILTPKNLLLKDVTFCNNRKYIIKPLKSIEGCKKDIAIVSTKEELDRLPFICSL